MLVWAKKLLNIRTHKKEKKKKSDSVEMYLYNSWLPSIYSAKTHTIW